MSNFPPYECTISPPYRPEDPLSLHRRYEIDIKRILNRFSQCYALYPEFDDTHRLHYHGIVYVHDKVKLQFTKYQLDKIGFTKILPFKSWKNMLRFHIYSLKQYASLHTTMPPIRYSRNIKTKQKCQIELDANMGSIYKYLV